jgi:all-trans-retinol 13,14-reductase
VQHIYCFVNLKGSPKELGLPSSNLWVYPEANFEKLMEKYYQNPLDNKMPLFIGSSSAKDESWEERFPGKSNLVILAPFPKNYLQEWEKQRCGKRHNDYKLIKTELAQKMIREGIQKFYPRALGKIISYTVGTPLTTQHYLGCVEGESYGLLSNRRRFLETELLNPKTQIDNFYLTGQDVCTLGVTGAMMGGILTANQIMGYGCLTDVVLGNNIVEDIIKKY